METFFSHAKSFMSANQVLGSLTPTDFSGFSALYLSGIDLYAPLYSADFTQKENTCPVVLPASGPISLSFLANLSEMNSCFLIP